MILWTVISNGSSKHLLAHQGETTYKTDPCSSCASLKSQAHELVHHYFPNIIDKDCLQMLPESINLMMNENHRLRHDYQLLQHMLWHHQKTNESLKEQKQQLKEELVQTQRKVNKLNLEIQQLKHQVKKRTLQKKVLSESKLLQGRIQQRKSSFIDRFSKHIVQKRESSEDNIFLSPEEFASIESDYYRSRWIRLDFAHQLYPQSMRYSSQSRRIVQPETPLSISRHSSIRLSSN